MDTTTVLVVIGCGVLVKTLAFIAFVVRRDRRQRRALAAARAAAVPVPTVVATSGVGLDPLGWRLHWAEPGVLLVENTDDADAVRDVELAATLTSADGRASSAVERERFVGTGACFEVRFVELEHQLWEGLGGDPADARQRLACTLDYVMSWSVSDGGTRRESRSDLPVVPVPDLALDAA